MFIKKLTGFLCLLIFALNFSGNIFVYALTPTEATSNEYLENHGYSADAVEMVNLQKARTEGYALSDDNHHSKLFMFMKNTFIYSDPTLSLTKFGTP